MEYVGGLGDAILRLYFSGKLWYGALEKMGDLDRAVVALMCHNSNLSEIFKWHPKRKHIGVLDFGFNMGFHPWENEDWRVARGLPAEAICPPHAPAETLTFYPSPEDKPLLDALRGKKFIVMGATASTDERTIPEPIRHECAREAIKRGFEVLVVGRSRYFHQKRQNDIPMAPGVIDAVDRLSVPGTIEAIKLSAGAICAHSAVLHMAWSERKPVFLLYNEWMKKNLLPHGAVGYMQGINRDDTDHMEFSEYMPERIIAWVNQR